MKKKTRGIVYDTAHATLLATNGRPFGKGYQALYIMASGQVFVYTHAEEYEAIGTINAKGVEHWLSAGYMKPAGENAATLIMEYLVANDE